MAYRRDITEEDKIFYDTDNILNYTVYQGDPTAEEIEAGTAVPQDVSGWTLGWFFRKKTGTADPPLIYKSNTGSPADGIAIIGAYNVSPSLNTQRVQVTLGERDTYDPLASPAVVIRPGDYNYSLKRLDEGSNTILAWGKFKLIQAAAWEPD